MSIAVACIPEGYSQEQKAKLIQGIKKACMDGFGVNEDHSFVSINETKPENMDEQTRTMKSLFVYTTYGKSLEGKNIICKGFDEICSEVFQEDTARTIVIFKEHAHENAGSNGTLRPFMPDYEKMIKMMAQH